MTNEFKLLKVDIIVNDTKKMVQFYENVFEMKLSPIQKGPFTFYKGNIKGFGEIQFVPKEVVEVDIKQNRHQFNFRVNNLDEVIKKCLKFEGKQQSEIAMQENDRMFSVTDPDNNFIVFVGN